MVTLQIDSDLSGQMMSDFLKNLTEEQKVQVAGDFMEKAFVKDSGWSRDMYATLVKSTFERLTREWLQKNTERFSAEIFKILDEMAPEMESLVKTESVKIMTSAFTGFLGRCLVVGDPSMQGNQIYEAIRVRLAERGVFI